MDVKARFDSIKNNLDGSLAVTFDVSNFYRKDCLQTYNTLKNDDLTVKVSKFRQKRALEANALLWAMLRQIGDKLRISAEEAYRQCIRDTGLFMNMSVESERKHDLVRTWRSKGMGWFALETGESNGWTNYACYYGSSGFTPAEMSRMLDLVVDEAKGLGIETRRPDEIAKLVQIYGIEFNSKQK